MSLGIFAKTFVRASFAEALDALAQHHLRCVHFNFACVGLPPLPDRIAPEVLQQIRGECESRGIRLAGISGTFNMVDPDASKRGENLRRFAEVTRAARELGCGFVSLCTGSRDPLDMWRDHPENKSPEAWRDLLESLETALRTAEANDVRLGIEPETGNVVSSATKARQLLDELKSPRLKIIIDPANLFRSAEVGRSGERPATGGRVPGARVPLARMRERIDEAFQLLGRDIIMAHAKELAPDGSMGQLAPGQGILDWDFYLDCLDRIGFDGPVIMHGLREEQVGPGTEFVRRKLTERGYFFRAPSWPSIRGRDGSASET